MRKAASIASIILGVLLIVGGVATWFTVSGELADQKIVTSDDACLPGREVRGPFTAYCEAQVIAVHALEATGGLYYAEMDREDPLRATAANASFHLAVKARVTRSATEFRASSSLGGNCICIGHRAGTPYRSAPTGSWLG